MNNLLPVADLLYLAIIRDGADNIEPLPGRTCWEECVELMPEVHQVWLLYSVKTPVKNGRITTHVVHITITVEEATCTQ